MRKPFFVIILAAVIFLNQSSITFSSYLAVRSDENPFAEEDEMRRDSLEQSVSSVSLYSSDAAVDSGDDEYFTPETTYMIKFSDACPLSEMADILESETYELLGYSEQRMARISTGDIQAFLEKAGDRVAFSEQDEYVYLDSYATVPDDTWYPLQFSHTMMNIPAAWDYTAGNDSVIVAVIDSGISKSHPDFAGTSILAGKSYIYSTPGPCTGDSHGHGTMVSGVIAATTSNNIGIAGICKDVSILPMQIFDAAGSTQTFYEVEAIMDAADAGARVINMSFGGSSSPSVEAAIEYAASKNCILVASAGNDGIEIQKYPASYDEVISVASIDRYGLWSDFSTYNNLVDICAPGEEIVTTAASGSYVYVEGTSFSSPAVSAVAALAVALNPTLTKDNFMNLLVQTSTDVGDIGFDKKTGWGLIDAHEIMAILSGSSLTSYTVTFDPMNGTATATVRADQGHSIYPPTNPSRTNYNFAGWYEDAACTNPWEFATEKPAQDMTLYAKWTLNAIASFVNRLYQYCLGRDADPHGLSYWSERIASKELSGGQFAYVILFSAECQRYDRTDAQYVDLLYQTLFDRTADPSGRETWLDSLASGLSRYYVLHSFVSSKEFVDYAASSGISSGELTLSEPRDLYPQAARFVTRFYKECLGRMPDSGGLNYWVKALAAGSQTGASVAYAFVFSPEFQSRNVTDETYVTILYKAFLNRSPESSGFNSWLMILKNGATRQDVLSGFLHSPEFISLANTYGIVPGSL